MKKQVKGFTLIELIVVLAIFSIILFSAMSLMQPASKIMFSASTNESGNAYATNIATQLENDFASVEYLDCYNTIDDASLGRQGLRDSRVMEFAEYYYEGILKSGSTTAAPAYGTGIIHVMVIDNTPTTDANGNVIVNSTIQKYQYDADFTTGSVSISEDSATTITSAINKAAYDDYNFEIKMGNWDAENWDDASVPMTNDILNNASTAGGFTFSIRATTNRPRNGSIYSFYKQASVPLVNISNPSHRYYGLNETLPVNPGDPITFNIADIRTVSNLDADPTLTNSRKHALVLPLNARYNPVAADTKNTSYMFIYSYGAEIDTNP